VSEQRTPSQLVRTVGRTDVHRRIAALADEYAQANAAREGHRRDVLSGQIETLAAALWPESATAALAVASHARAVAVLALADAAPSPDPHRTPRRSQ